MRYTLRPYQKEAVDKGVEFFHSPEQFNAIEVLPTGSGKSLVISELANRVGDNVLVFQPSKEILEQNLTKMRTYTDECSAYSSSLGASKKFHKVSKITFATIGSVKNHIEEFKHFKYVIVDECHSIGSDNENSMYLTFLSMLNCKVLGLTATPFRLTADRVWSRKAKVRKDDNGNVMRDTNGDVMYEPGMTTENARLTMLINEDKPFFSKIIYIRQIGEMVTDGYLARLRYFDLKPTYWNDSKIFTNSNGTDFSDKSVKWMMESSDLTGHLVSICRRLLQPKDGKPRNGILVFTQFVEDAERIANEVADAAYLCGTTLKKNRDRILQDFKDGKIKVLANVGVLVCGFDFPALDTIVMGRPTLSLAMHYQILGRAIRKFDGKDAWVIDCVGNTNRFGQVENIYIGESTTGNTETFGWVYNWHTRKYGWKQLTGVNLKEKQPEQKTINFK